MIERYYLERGNLIGTLMRSFYHIRTEAKIAVAERRINRARWLAATCRDLFWIVSTLRREDLKNAAMIIQ